MALALRYRGPLDVSALEQALTDFLERHQAWRGGGGGVRLSLLDLRGRDAAVSHAAALASDDARQPFDVASGPRYRARLVRLGADDHALYLTLHHSIADSVTIHGCLVPGLPALYAARAGGAPASAACVPHRGFAAPSGPAPLSATATEPLDFWRRRLASPPPAPDLRADRVRTGRGLHGARLPLALGPACTDAVRSASHRAGVGIFVTVLAGFVALLHRYTDEDDIIVGTLISGARPGGARCFIDPLALRIDAGGEPSFGTLQRRVDEAVRDALDHADVRFDDVVSAVGPSPGPTRHPLFSHAVTLQSPAAPAGWELIDLDGVAQAAPFDLHLDLYEGADDIRGGLTYRTDVFEASMVARLADHFRLLLAAAAAEPDRPVSQLPLLDEHERRRIVVEFNQRDRRYPDQATVHELVAEHARRAPDRTAIVAGDTSMSYGELQRRADLLGTRLRALGIGRGAVVGVAMERSPEVIVVYLAVLTVGAAYLPLNVNDPPERLRFMIDDAGARAIVTGEAGLPGGAAIGVQVIEVGAASPSSSAAPDSLAAERATADDLIYVMYTSGSTGRPKGVAVPHRGLVRLLRSEDAYVRLGPDEVILQATALSFDVAAFEIWGALVHGARLVLYPSDVPTPRELGTIIRRYGITTMWLTGSVFNMVVEADPAILAPLRQLDLGGEALSVPHVSRAAAVLSATRLINGYGPTECSVSATAYDIPRTIDPAAASIPIGRPIANTTAYVLDRHGAPVPIGMPGELHLGGPGLARGYVNRPQETAERFVPDPFSPAPGHRLYRTGDLARWRADGTLDYLGRMDAQVKIRGLRVELGEIESVLRRHDAVADAAVVVHDDAGAKRLTAYVVARPGRTLAPGALRDHARDLLPPYMVPAAVVPLTALPLTRNGKLDRRALATAPPPALPVSADAVRPPVDSLEGQLVELWQERLGIRPIATGDDFFDLGGTSLTAAYMMQQVAELTGHTLPLDTLYHSPTIDTLAQQLRERSKHGVDGTAAVVTLNQHGDRIPLILFHGMLTGGAFYALRLARRLGPRQPVHVMRPFTGGERPIPKTIETMVDHYLGLLRTVQPRGPYRLAGYCNGGLVAYETARRLQAAGERVDLVALIAAVPVTSLARTGRAVRSAAGALGIAPAMAGEPVARLRSFLEGLAAVPGRERLAFAGAKAVELAHRARRWVSPGAPDEALDVMASYHRVFMRYFPRPSTLPIIIMWPEQERWGGPDAAAAAWRPIARVTAVHVVPGDHLGVLHEHLDLLAAPLASYLDRDAAAPRTPEPIRRPVMDIPALVAHTTDVLLEHALELAPCLV